MTLKPSTPYTATALDTVTEDVARLRRENARLREALERIAAYPARDGNSVRAGRHMVAVANEVLTGDAR